MRPRAAAPGGGRGGGEGGRAAAARWGRQVRGRVYGEECASRTRRGRGRWAAPDLGAISARSRRDLTLELGEVEPIGSVEVEGGEDAGDPLRHLGVLVGVRVPAHAALAADALHGAPARRERGGVERRAALAEELRRLEALLQSELEHHPLPLLHEEGLERRRRREGRLQAGGERAREGEDLWGVGAAMKRTAATK